MRCNLQRTLCFATDIVVQWSAGIFKDKPLCA